MKSRHETDLARLRQSGELVKLILIDRLDKTIRIYWSQTPFLYAKHACTPMIRLQALQKENAGLSTNLPIANHPRPSSPPHQWHLRALVLWALAPCPERVLRSCPGRCGHLVSSPRSRPLM